MGRELKHILCIDDQEDILEVTRMCLETVGGYQVTICNNGRGGIDTAREIGPDVILIDVMMPDTDGPAALRILQQDNKLRDIPVIFMTARVHKSEVEEYIKMGAVGVISKPFNPMGLAGEIQTIWSNLNG